MPQHIIRQIPACRLFSDSYLDPQKILSAKLRNDIFAGTRRCGPNRKAEKP